MYFAARYVATHMHGMQSVSYNVLLGQGIDPMLMILYMSIHMFSGFIQIH